MTERLTEKLEAHHKAFVRKQLDDDEIEFSSWFLSMVVFPSLRDIAERIDAIEASRRKKGTDGGH